MTKFLAFTAAALLATSAAAFADGHGHGHHGDPKKGEKEFNRCKACHMIVDDEGNAIVKGGKTGPNLYGVVGRPVASVEGFKYGDGILAVGETGMVWEPELLVEYAMDPTKFIDTHGGSGRSKMTFKIKDASNIVAFLASVAPAPEAATEEAADEAPAEDAATE
ncbi:cytochrome C [Celeribacter halophilus]|jgi:cytochrome c|uniref:Cytochrome C n=1 Tax=Celeribacter halophilus TaxID=576117 RepID=A0AAW7XWP3_9RHOB|nr:cytochrome C [Celeribacter halophilus]MDO6458706.1 cytochrome C [Celeribacter halophilus]MDO6722464.1 cytochrome C [Celeribacter halophilus]